MSSLPLTDNYANQVISLWKSNFPMVAVIAMPSEAGSLTLGHTIPSHDYMMINGLRMKSPLFTMGLYSSEVALDEHGVPHYGNAYEIMLPDIPSTNGSPSSTGLYVQYLKEAGIDVHSDHYHWKGTGDLVPAIHSFNSTLTPIEFSRRTINALKKTLA